MSDKILNNIEIIHRAEPNYDFNQILNLLARTAGYKKYTSAISDSDLLAVSQIFVKGIEENDEKILALFEDCPFTHSYYGGELV